VSIAISSIIFGLVYIVDLCERDQLSEVGCPP